MPVTVYCKTSSAPPRMKAKLRKSLAALLAFMGKRAANLEVSLVGTAEIRRLNKKFRKKDRVTDVLSFPQDAKPPVRGRPWFLGEIVIALPVARAQARQAGRTPSDHAIRLAVHGLAHLVGLDHETSAAEERRFQRLERKWLRRLQQKGWMQWDGVLPF